MSPPSATAQPAEPLTKRQIRAILGGLMAGMFMAALHQTIVTTAVRTIADDLQGLQYQAWAITAYLIAATIATPIYGKLSDIYGRKPFFLGAISIFLFGALLCTLSMSMQQLAMFRAVQGLGAGGLFSLALAIVSDIVSPRERARYQGYFLAVFGVASVLGPVIGGFFAGQESILGLAGWRWLFLFIAPFAVIAMVIVTRTLNLTHFRLQQRIDWGSAAGLCLGLVPLLLVVELGRDWGWTSPESLLCYGLGAIGLTMFVFFTARMGDEALLPWSLLKIRTVAIGATAAILIGAGMFIAMTTLPLYLQIVRGATPTQAGMMMVAMTLGMMVGSVISGQLITRTGRYRIFPVSGSAVMAAALFVLAFLGVSASLGAVLAVMLLLGIGLGNCLQPMTLAVQNAAPPDQIGVATSTATFTRQIGGTVGTATFMALLFAQAPGLIERELRRAEADPAFQQALADNPAFAHDLSADSGGLLDQVMQDSSFLIGLDPVLAQPFLEGFADAMQIVFIAGGVVMLVAFIATLLLPELPLGTRSAYAQRSEARRAEAPAAKE